MGMGTNFKCDFCFSTDLILIDDVGFDVWEGGEENQYIQECNKCGAKRFVSDVNEYTGKIKRHYGKWGKKENWFGVI